jgi:hypothetical protein
MYFGIKTNRMSVHPPSQAEKLDSDGRMASRDG